MKRFLIITLLLCAVNAGFAQTNGNFTKITVKDSIWLAGKWVKMFSSDSAMGTGDPGIVPTQAGVKSALSGKLNLSEKGAANGVASLDGAGKVPMAQLPASLMIYKGVWNPATNTPVLSDGTGASGAVYKAEFTGVDSVVVNLGSGNITFYQGDWAIHNGTRWEHSASGEKVVTVNGKWGMVVLNKADIGLPNVDNTADLNKPISTATQAALDGKAPATGSLEYVQVQTAAPQTGGYRLTGNASVGGNMVVGSSAAPVVGFTLNNKQFNMLNGTANYRTTVDNVNGWNLMDLANGFLAFGVDPVGNGTMNGSLEIQPAQAGTQAVTRDQMTDTLNARGAGVIPTLQQVTTAGGSTTLGMQAATLITTNSQGLTLANDEGYVAAFNSPGTIQNGYLQWSTSAANMGLYTNNAWSMTFGTSGIGRLRITPLGRVLVNQTTDDGTSQLQVTGAIGTSVPNGDIAYLIKNPSGFSKWSLFGTNSEVGSNMGYDLGFARYDDAGAYAGAVMLLQRSTGNVGIGLTNPSQKLEVSGNILANTSNDEGFILNGGNAILRNSGTGLNIVTGGGNLLLNTSANVGIGTSNPLYKLDIAGNTRATSFLSTDIIGFRSANDNGKMRFYKADNTTQVATVGISTSDGFTIYADANMNFETSSGIQPALRINKNLQWVETNQTLRSTGRIHNLLVRSTNAETMTQLQYGLVFIDAGQGTITVTLNYTPEVGREILLGSENYAIVLKDSGGTTVANVGATTMTTLIYTGPTLGWRKKSVEPF